MSHRQPMYVYNTSVHMYPSRSFRVDRIGDLRLRRVLLTERPDPVQLCHASGPHKKVDGSERVVDRGDDE